MASRKSNARVGELENEVRQVTDIMRTNVEKVLERDEKLHLLEDRAVNLSTEARQFKTQAKNVQRKMWWKNVKFKIILVIVVLLILGAIGGIVYWQVSKK